MGVDRDGKQGFQNAFPPRSMPRRTQLEALCRHLREDDGDLELIISQVRHRLHRILGVERFTVYERTDDGRQICSRVLAGTDLDEIRLPLSPTSIAGYVAMSQEAICIDDVYDVDQLKSIHSRLEFDHRFDQASGFLTRSVLCIPIVSGKTLLGVLQMINRLGGRAFSDEDLELGALFARELACRLGTIHATTEGPFELLVREKVLTSEQLLEATEIAAQHDLSVGYVLRVRFAVSNEQLGGSLEQHYHVPFLGFDPERELPTRLMEALNTEFLVANCWVPVEGDETRAVILIDNPNDSLRLMEIQRILSADAYEFLVGIPEDIYRYLGVEAGVEVHDILAPDANLEELVVRLDEEHTSPGSPAQESATGELLDENAATVVALVNKIIADGVQMAASDIHVEPSRHESPGTVRFRIDGVCRDVLQVPKHYVRYLVARIKIMSKMDIAETRLPQDGKINCRLQGEPLELRVVTLPTVNGEGVIMRILSSGEPLPFERLGFSSRNRGVVEGMVHTPHGLVLAVGPTGSGKTTTLHALLRLVNTPERKVITAEDPVEITQPRMQQVQIHHQIGLDFARALRSFLRSDPDVILIGEMRDYETAHVCVEASLTGHLVFSTLHTNSAPETVSRLLDMGLDPFSFSDALLGVVAQRLVRTLCAECKEAYEPSEEDVAHLVELYGEQCISDLGEQVRTDCLYRPKGCEACGGAGYKGRMAIHEVLVGTTAMKELVSGKPRPQQVRDLAMKEGMRTLLQDGIAKVFAGHTDLVQVRAVTVV